MRPLDHPEINTSRAAEVDARYPGLLVAIAKAHEIQMTDQAPTLADAERFA